MEGLIAFLVFMVYLSLSGNKKKMPKHWTHKRTEAEAQAEKEWVLNYLKPK